MARNVTSDTSKKTKSKIRGAYSLTHALKSRVSSLKSRRPHRSFRRTYRREYTRTLDIPGYWSFTAHVFRTLRANRKIFGLLAVFYGLTTAAFVGLASQETYAQLSVLLDESSSKLFVDGWGTVGQAGLLLSAGLSGGFNPQLSEAQQVYVVIIVLLTWLTTVWLLRAILTGKRPKLRDGLYNGGAPIVASAGVVIVLLIQLIPAALGIIAFNSAVSTDLFASGFIAMVVSLVVVLLFIVSLFWATSTFFAMVIVTLPGMYPLQAVRAAGDIVTGRRIRLLLRIIWLQVLNLVFCALIILPVVLIDRALAGTFDFFQYVPLVPLAIAIVGSVVVVWSAAYVYLLYRKVVEDVSSPA